jgi:dihydrofolate reductase
MMISMVAAIGKNRQLGKDNQLLWHISEDLKNFKRLTLERPIVMGRKTFESIGKPLPKRVNIILTRDENFRAENCEVFHDKETLLQWCQNQSFSEVVIIGGSEIYKLFLPETKKLFLSRVDYDGPADVYFPDFDETKWSLKNEVNHPALSNSPAWSFHEYELN